jgi:hypothetical protein
MHHWSDAYLQIPYSDCDCGSLVQRVQREVFGRELALPNEHACNQAGKSKQIATLIDDFGARTDSPADGDGVLVQCGPLWHVCTYCEIGRQRWLLHTTLSGKFSARILLRRAADLNMRVEAYYKWH